MFKRVLVVFLGVIAAASLSFADTIGYLDTATIFREYKGAVTAQKELQKQQAVYRKEFEKGQREINKARKKGASDKKIQAMVDKIEKGLKPKKEKLVQLNQQLSQQLKGDILVSVKKVSKAYGVDVVIDKQVVLSGGFDLTPFVLEDLNKKK